MASNRIRAIRNVSNRLVNYESKINFSARRPAPRRLADNFIFTNNVRREAIVEPLLAADSVTTEKIEENAVTNDELASDAVDTDNILLDAIDGKNITSCNITDSTIENCEILSSTLEDVDITDSRLDGADVILTECTLQNCEANEILGIGGLSLVGNGDIGILGSGVVIDGGGSLITVADGNIGLGAGSTISIDPGGFNFGGDLARFTAPWGNVQAAGIPFWQHPQFVNVKQKAEQALDIAQQALAKANSLGPCACP